MMDTPVPGWNVVDTPILDGQVIYSPVLGGDGHFCPRWTGGGLPCPRWTGGELPCPGFVCLAASLCCIGLMMDLFLIEAVTTTSHLNHSASSHRSLFFLIPSSHSSFSLPLQHPLFFSFNFFFPNQSVLPSLSFFILTLILPSFLILLLSLR
jgi:hypothetical protein